MKKACSAMTLGAAVALTLAACGTPPAQRPTRNLEGAKNFTACMLSDEGGFDDHSFNESGKKGLDRAGKELGVKTIAVQSESSADYATNIYALIQQNCKLVIGVGFNIAADLTESAKANPDIQFALIDASFIGADGKPAALPNTKPLLFKTAEAAYLAGYAAAGTSRTGVVGTYGGKPLPTVQIFMDGFAKGVARYNQDTGAQVQVKGWDTTTGKGGSFVGNFTDAAKGQAITEQFISQGADIIMPVAGPVGQGTLSSVRQKNDAGGTNAVIWVDSDGYTSSGDGTPPRADSPPSPTSEPSRTTGWPPHPSTTSTPGCRRRSRPGSRSCEARSSTGPSTSPPPTTPPDRPAGAGAPSLHRHPEASLL